MLSAIFLRMESKTVEIEELDRSMLEVRNFSHLRSLVIVMSIY